MQTSLANSTWVIYTRKSVASSDNHSLLEQEQCIKIWAESMNYIIYPQVFSDVVSGVADMGDGINEKNGLKKALETMKSIKATGLICTRLDRLSRDTFQTLSFLKNLDDNKLSFTCATEPDMSFGPFFSLDNERNSRILLLVKCITAEGERHNIRSRTQMSCNQRSILGMGQSGNSPFGYRFQITLIDGTLIQSHTSHGHVRDKEIKLTLVPHEYEKAQMESLSHLFLTNEAPRRFLSTLAAANMDDDSRKPGQKITNASLLKKNVQSYLDYKNKLLGNSAQRR